MITRARKRTHELVILKRDGMVRNGIMGPARDIAGRQCSLYVLILAKLGWRSN
jgi:hypothetical protein